jgi:crossover junction endodeoxyribonuclease RuvC
MATRRATAPPEPRQRILGIDPGTNLTGYAILDREGSKLTLVTLGVIRPGKLGPDADHPDKLAFILQRVTELVKTWQPDTAAVEAPFFGKNVQSMLKLGRVQGVVMAAALSQGIPIVEYSPRLVKKAVTGGGNATKEQVAALLTQQLPNVPTFADSGVMDATDALAVAFCHANRQRGPQAAAASHKSWDSFLKANPDMVIRSKP